ncbi:hypothetical protein [Sporocytophaga myxococcoides]|uniref:hypothetical protein n=1 Tax=Sporocytophaga myxococcoides TaxID=153721 RepID=UPI0012DFF3FF|nr:hypothetical protein [Sporocytophaga myxococcoides]
MAQNDYKISDSLQSWGYVKNGIGWGIDSSYNDTFKTEDLSVKKLFSLPAPFIAFDFIGSGTKRCVYYVINIEDVHYYIKEALKTVNKDKVQTNIVVENSNKGLEMEVTKLHFEPKRITKGAIITDIYLMPLFWFPDLLNNIYIFQHIFTFIKDLISLHYHKRQFFK